MAVVQPRTKLVNFRVSEDEFKSLKEATEAEGARSLSDHARNKVLGATNVGVGTQITQLRDEVAELTDLVKKLLGESTTAVTQQESISNGISPH